MKDVTSARTAAFLGARSTPKRASSALRTIFSVVTARSADAKNSETAAASSASVGSRGGADGAAGSGSAAASGASAPSLSLGAPAGRPKFMHAYEDGRGRVGV